MCYTGKWARTEWSSSLFSGEPRLNIPSTKFGSLRSEELWEAFSTKAACTSLSEMIFLWVPLARHHLKWDDVHQIAWLAWVQYESQRWERWWKMSKEPSFGDMYVATFPFGSMNRQEGHHASSQHRKGDGSTKTAEPQMDLKFSVLTATFCKYQIVTHAPCPCPYNCFESEVNHEKYPYPI